MTVIALWAPAAADSEGDALGPEALSGGVPADAVRASGAWFLAEDAPAPTFAALARHARGEANELEVSVTDVQVFGFHVEVEGKGRVVFRVDGEEVASFGAGDLRPFDVPLTTARHELSWTFRAERPTDAARVVLEGARALLPPVVLDFSRTVVACPGDVIRFALSHALPALDVRASVGLDAWGVAHSAGAAAGRPVTWVDLELGEIPDGGATYRVRLVVEDALGEVWDLGEMILDVVLPSVPVARPQAWAYDLRPAIRLDSWCAFPEGTAFALDVDGEDVTERLSVSRRKVAFPLERELEFGEAVAYRFTVTYPSGRTVAYEGAFREGLDVLDFDVTGGVLVYAAASDGAWFGNPAAPDELPLVRGSNAGAALDARAGAVVLPTPTGARVRALYAPLELVCGHVQDAAACSPYGGRAPGFLPRHADAATLEVTLPGGLVRELPALGQWAAASRLSRVTTPDPELEAGLEVDAEVEEEAA